VFQVCNKKKKNSCPRTKAELGPRNGEKNQGGPREKKKKGKEKDVPNLRKRKRGEDPAAIFRGGKPPF